MRNWNQENKQSLRLLAAARYFLPGRLDGCAELEQEYQACLSQTAFSTALGLLEQIGDLHSGYENEMHFWKELYYAAQHMNLPDHASRYEARICQLVDMQRLPF